MDIVGACLRERLFGFNRISKFRVEFVYQLRAVGAIPLSLQASEQFVIAAEVPRGLIEQLNVVFFDRPIRRPGMCCQLHPHQIGFSARLVPV